jgi:tRNA(Ile)-lysidine synthase
LRGIVGIPSNNNNLLRPLLIFSKDQILDYAKKYKIKWREDSSNKENKYLRNFIRNKIIKDWIKYEPELINKFSSTLKNLNSTYEAFKVIIKKFKKDYFVENGNGYYISIKELTKLNPIDFYLFQLFEAYGYTNTKDLSNLINSQSGKYLLSKSHRLTKGRKVLILSKIKNLSKDEFYWNLKKSFNIPIELKIVKNNNFDNKTISLNKNDLKLPLIVRKWKIGDFFYPKGMKGKKKISKYFKDEKFDINQKENQWLLCSGDNILWVIGERADRRFLAKKQSSNIINIECR